MTQPTKRELLLQAARLLNSISEQENAYRHIRRVLIRLEPGESVKIGDRMVTREELEGVLTRIGEEIRPILQQAAELQDRAIGKGGTKG